MPTYHARDITVRLGSLPLDGTTTSNIVLRKGEVAKQQSELASKQLLRSSYLQEKRVLFPGDPDGFELNWLGNAPFMQVEAEHASGAPLWLSDCPSQSRTAQALALHVKLSDKSFQSSFAGKFHLKIEILFNGQLSACSLIHTNDVRSGAKSLHQVFGGYRVDFLAERPWVLLPSFTNADGGTRRFRKTISPSERFAEISAALLKEAEERGTDRSGAPPPSAYFIHALAKMQTPASVLNMQKPGGRKLGIVDVIITAGTGNKLTNGMNYLKRPQRLKDSTYIVRTGIESDVERKPETPAAILRKTPNTTDLFSQASSFGLYDTHAGMGGTIDTQDQRPSKRQAFSSGDRPQQHETHRNDFQCPFMGVRVPLLPPPNVLSTPIRIGSRSPSLEHRSDGHKEPLPSNERSHECYAPREVSQTYGVGSNAFHSHQKYHSLPISPSPKVLHPIPSPPTRAGTSPSDVMTVHEPLDTPSCSGATGRMSSPITPHMAHMAWLLPSPTSSMSPPYFHLIHFPPQVPSDPYPSTPFLSKTPNGLHCLIPETPVRFDHQTPTPYILPALLPSPAPQVRGPLPPTAMFSVPSQQRRSASPTKNIPVAKPAASNSDVFIRRLVIRGLNDRLVVDHRWKVPKSVAVHHRCCPKEKVQGLDNPRHVEQEELNARSCAQQQSRSGTKRSLHRPGCSAPVDQAKSSSDDQNICAQRRDIFKNAQLGFSARPPLPYLKRHQGPMNGVLPVNTRIDVPDNIAPFVAAKVMETQTQLPESNQMTHNASPAARESSRRRAFPRNALPGIQGPKATTFLFDDPEEVLREAAKLRRSRSPMKPVAMLPLSSAESQAHLDPAPDSSSPGDSSPLSSVPSSPLPDTPVVTFDAAHIPLSQIPQLDGMSDRTLPTAILRESSPQNPALPTSKLQRPSPATSQSSLSPDQKKRKFLQQSPVKIPRSPDRLKTVSNPPLNEDCVIAFAESIDKDEKRGVLRQVKGERQGVFKEDHVVLAVRFFIAGG